MIYLVSILPALGVFLLSGKTPVLAALGVILLQHAINVLNDRTDWTRGADVNKTGSWARFHGRDLDRVARHGYASFTAGLLLGGLALWRADKLWLLAAAAPLVALGLLYNSGKRPLSYTASGEWVTALCYGPGVFGCLWLVEETRLTLPALLASFSYGALAAAVLLSHQPPQIDDDRRAGKLSFAVRHGAGPTRLAARRLFAGAAMSLTAAIALSHAPLTAKLVAAGAVPLALFIHPAPAPFLIAGTAWHLAVLAGGSS